LLGALASIGSDELKIIDHRLGLIAILSALLVLSASYDNNYFFRNSWIKPVFMWIGSRSYALYLTHLPSYFLTREIWFRIEPPGTSFGPDYSIPAGSTKRSELSVS
jgi:peptidoglycan/LPS O-acetylase OafA/YrhL